jgi:hypothetical protein
MRNHDKTGKYDLRAETPDGDVMHVCRYSSEEEAQEGKERLQDPDEETRDLIGLPEEFTLRVEPAA